MAESIPEKRKFVTTWEGAVNRDGRLPLSAIKVTAFSRNLGGTMEYTLHPLRDGAFLFCRKELVPWSLFCSIKER